MKRFKLTRKEKLLYATPLLVPLLVWVWPLVSANSLDRTLRELSGPQAVDCRNIPSTFSTDLFYDPCAVAAFKAGKPFIARHIPSDDPKPREVWGLAGTPQGQVYAVYYYRRHWREKAGLIQSRCVNPRVLAAEGETPRIIYDYQETRPDLTRVWR